MNIHEIERFDFPSGFKSYRPKKKKQFPYLLLILVIFLISWLIHSFVEPSVATAKTLEAKDCMSNQCILDIVCGEETDYTNVKDICHG